MFTRFDFQSPRRKFILAVTATMLALFVAGCSSGGNSSPAPAATSAVETSPQPTPTAAAAPTAAPTPEPTAEPVEDVVPTEVPVANVEPTPVPVADEPAQTVVEPTAEPTTAPEPTATPEPTPTPEPLTNVYNKYGFTVELDQDATFADSGLNVSGWSDETADSTQGLMTFNYNGADVVIFWQPDASKTAQETVDLTYQLQQLGNPDSTFTPLSSGDLTVDGSDGRFTGFLSTDNGGENATGGIIGAWTCADSGTQLSMTTTGSDSTALQIRFDRIISGFSCDAS